MEILQVQHLSAAILIYIPILHYWITPYERNETVNFSVIDKKVTYANKLIILQPQTTNNGHIALTSKFCMNEKGVKPHIYTYPHIDLSTDRFWANQVNSHAKTLKFVYFFIFKMGNFMKLHLSVGNVDNVRNSFSWGLFVTH